MGNGTGDLMLAMMAGTSHQENACDLIRSCGDGNSGGNAEGDVTMRVEATRNQMYISRVRPINVNVAFPLVGRKISSLRVAACRKRNTAT